MLPKQFGNIWIYIPKEKHILSSETAYYLFPHLRILPTSCLLYRQLTEEILADDSTTTKCYSPLAKTQVRKQKKESTSYRYAKRESWSSTDNSMEVPRRQRGHSGISKSPHSSTEMLNLTDVRTPLQMNTSARPSFLRTRATIPNMSMKTREMAGGQADYV